MRPTKDEYYYQVAKVIASRSTCLKKNYGAVIVKDDAILSTGYNGSPHGEPNCCDTGCCYACTHTAPVSPISAIHGCQYGMCVAVHAEQNALILADPRRVKGATIYLAGYNPNTKEWINACPCNICERMLKNAGIIRIVSKEDIE